jgi:CRP/FNR family transcriptional regulator
MPLNPLEIQKIHIYEQNDVFKSVFVLVSGSSKSVVRSSDGSERISDVALRSDMVGVSGLVYGFMPEGQVALENLVFCVIPYQRLIRLMQHDSLIGMQFHKVAIRTALQRQFAHLLVSNSSADRQVGGFLVWLARQLAARGQHFTDFRLPLSRGDLANFLGIRLETVSRAFSRLAKLQLTKTQGRHVRILDLPALERWAASITY